MAKLIEQTIVLTVSKMIKSSEHMGILLDEEQVSQLEAVVAELAGDGCIVEMAVESK